MKIKYAAALLKALGTPRVYIFLSTCLLTSIALGNPVINNVASGNVSITQTPNVTTINQSSGNAILNWQSFNIAKGQATHFIQPTGGIALNRISPLGGASQIYGVLTATGRIILINSAGIYFGPGSYVNVGGLVATTENLTDKNFLSGNYQFQGSPFNTASITNAGNHYRRTTRLSRTGWIECHEQWHDQSKSRQHCFRFRFCIHFKFCRR